MKKIFTLALLAGAVVTSASAQSKFDAEGRSIMQQYEYAQLNPNARLIEMPAVIPANALSRSDSQVSVIVTLHDGYTSEAVEAMGFEILASAGTHVVASGTFANIQELEKCDFVKAMTFGRVREAALDVSRQYIGADDIHAGTGFSKGYTGEGVIAAIFDTGMDPNHANFINSDTKESRVGIVWNVSNEGQTVRTYDTAASIASFTTENAEESHGTHTMGCMTGSYNGRGGKVAIVDENGRITTRPTNKNPYYGIATGSTIAAGCGSLTDANILKGVDLMVKYAKEQNKPIVINLSLGDNIGSHDQFDPVSAMLDEYAKDAIICISAGNEGGSKLSIDKTLTSSEKTISTFFYSNQTYEGRFDVWSDSSEPFTLYPFVYNLAEKKIEYELACGGGSEKEITLTTPEYAGSNESSPIFNRAFTASYLQVTTSKNEGTSKRYNASVRLQIAYNTTNNSNKNLVLGFRVEGKAGQRLMLASMSSNGAQFVSLDQPGFTEGNDVFSLNSMACGLNTLCVGAWNGRNKMPTYDYGFITYGNDYLANVGGIAEFSSYATLHDGRTFPHVCAPGVGIISSISKYYYDKNADGLYLTASQEFNGRSNHWMYMQGTSMSSPIVAGSIATWLEADPTLTIAEVQNIVKNHSIVDEFVSASTNKVQWGAGKFDALAGLKYVIEHSAGVNDVLADNGDKFILTPRGENAWEVYVPLAENVNVAVYNPAGQLVKTASADGSELNLDANDLNNGIYIISINGIHSTRVVVK